MTLVLGRWVPRPAKFMMWKDRSMSDFIPHKLGLARMAVAGAATSVTFYLICWIGAFLPIGPATHMYLQLFTNAEAASVTALAVGLCWSLAFGLIVGALFTTFYNLLISLDR